MAKPMTETRPRMAYTKQMDSSGNLDIEWSRQVPLAIPVRTLRKMQKGGAEGDLKAAGRRLTRSNWTELHRQH